MASNFCRNCGSRLTEGKPFCGNCGTRVIVRDAVTVKPESPAMPQPLQTLVTYHPENPVPAEELPAQALQPVAEVPAVPAAPAEEPVQAAEILPAQ
nr:zinc-ribbon domain-containing protein [Saccharofermentans sp.]